MGTSTVGDGEIRARHINSNAELPVAGMELISRTFVQPLTSAVVWDSGQPLPSTAANDDLGFNFGSGISATETPVIETGDIKTLSSTRKCAFPIVLPDNYATGKSIAVSFYAGAKTTVADTSMTIDAEVFLSDKDGTSNTDICATNAQSINSLTAADYSFTITPTGRVAGEQLWVLVSIAYVDGASGTAVIGQFGEFKLTCTCRG